MAAVCQFPMCKRVAEANGYCVGHRIYAKSTTSTTAAKNEDKPKPQGKKIKPIADKMKKVLQELEKIKKRRLKEQPLCQLRTPVCTKWAKTMHHTKGRTPKQILKEKDMLESCYECNTWVEQHDGQARDKGLKKSKFTPKP